MTTYDHVDIFDTTLRDGAQSPGASMNTREKLEIAGQLLRLGVDVIEAGFPISSPDNFHSVDSIAKLVGANAVVCALSRAVSADIEEAARALKNAKRPRIHTGIGASESHLRDKLHISGDEAIESATAAVALARKYVDDVEFYAEDAARADRDFLIRMLRKVVRAGATVINIPDTTGYSDPFEFGSLIERVKREVDLFGDITISVHCHNDLGMATANALAGIRAGARQVECTINGLGERAGNAALEEVVMAIRQRPDLYEITTGINTPEITRTSRLVSSITGINVQPNKAIVGANAFAHSSGIHQDGVLKERTTYETIDPADVGADGSKIILTASSGRHALRHRLRELGYNLPSEEFEQVYMAFLELADKKKEVLDEDLAALVGETERLEEEIFHLEKVQASTGDPGIPTATVELVRVENGEHLVGSGHGNGPVEAVYMAVDRIVAVHAKLVEFNMQAVTPGMDAQGGVSIRIKDEDGRVFTGRGAHSDIIVASAKAYINALNRLLAARELV